MPTNFFQNDPDDWMSISDSELESAVPAVTQPQDPDDWEVVPKDLTSITDRLQKDFQLKFKRPFRVTTKPGGGGLKDIHNKLYKGEAIDIGGSDLSDEEADWLVNQMSLYGLRAKDYRKNWKSIKGSGPHIHGDFSIQKEPEDPGDWQSISDKDLESLFAQTTPAPKQQMARRNLMFGVRGKRLDFSREELEAESLERRTLEDQFESHKRSGRLQEADAIGKKLQQIYGYSLNYDTDSNTGISWPRIEPPKYAGGKEGYEKRLRKLTPISREDIDRKREEISRSMDITPGATTPEGIPLGGGLLVKPPALQDQNIIAEIRRERGETKLAQELEQEELDKLRSLSPEQKQAEVKKLSRQRRLTDKEKQALGVESGVLKSLATDIAAPFAGALTDIAGQIGAIGEQVPSYLNPVDLATRPAELLTQFISGKDVPKGSTALRQLGDEGSAYTKQLINTYGGEGFVPDVIRAMSGSVPLLAAGMIGGGPAVVAAVGGLQTAGQIRQEALDAGRSPEDATAISMLGLPIGYLERWGIGGAGIRFAKGQYAKSILQAIGRESGEELGQNKLQNILQDLTARGYYDPDRDIIIGLDYEDLIAVVTGGAMGGVLQTGVGSLQNRQERKFIRSFEARVAAGEPINPEEWQTYESLVNEAVLRERRRKLPPAPAGVESTQPVGPFLVDSQGNAIQAPTPQPSNLIDVLSPAGMGTFVPGAPTSEGSIPILPPPPQLDLSGLAGIEGTIQSEPEIPELPGVVYRGDTGAALEVIGEQGDAYRVRNQNGRTYLIHKNATFIPEIVTTEGKGEIVLHGQTGEPLTVLGTRGTAFIVKNEQSKIYTIHKNATKPIPISSERRAAIPESPETLSAQFQALEAGRKPAVLITPGEQLPDIPQGMISTETPVGTFIHPPSISQESVIEAVSTDNYHGLLGIVSPRPAEGEPAVTVVAQTKDGKELQTAIVSPEDAALQRFEFRKIYPDAVVTLGDEDTIKAVLSQRADDIERQQLESLQEEERQGEIIAETPALVTGIEGIVSRQKQELRKKERQLETDALTGVQSAKAFHEAKESIDKDPNREWITIDLNNFKSVNDTLGHAAGDDRLRAVGRAMLGIKAQNPQAQVFRAGGDEFSFAVPKGQGEKIARQIENDVGTEILPNGRIFSVSATTGDTYNEADAKLEVAKAERKAKLGGVQGGREATQPTPPAGTHPAVIKSRYAYRTRDVGEQGVPSESHSQATLSRQQAEGYVESRGNIQGKPQEVIKIDLWKLEPSEYNVAKAPGDTHWIKFNRPLPETDIEVVVPAQEILPEEVSFNPSNIGIQIRQDLRQKYGRDLSVSELMRDLTSIHKRLQEKGLDAYGQLEAYRVMGFDFKDPIEMAGYVRAAGSEFGDFPIVNVLYRIGGQNVNYRVLGRFPNGEKIMVMGVDSKIKIIQSPYGETGNIRIKGGAARELFGRVPPIAWQEIGMLSDAWPTKVEIRRVNPNVDDVLDLTDSEIQNHFPEVWKRIREAQDGFGDSTGREMARLASNEGDDLEPPEVQRRRDYVRQIFNQPQLKVDNSAEMLYNTTVVAGYDLLKHYPDRDSWELHLVEKLGDNIKPYLSQAWDAIHDRAPMFFSPLERAIKLDLPAKAPATDVKNILRKSGVSDDEMRWTGFDEFLKEKAMKEESITRQEALDFFQKNKVVIQETIFRGDKDLAKRQAQEDLFKLEKDFMDLLVKNGIPQELTHEIALSARTHGSETLIFRAANLKEALNNTPESDRNKLIQIANEIKTKDDVIVSSQYRTAKFTSWTTPGGTNHREITLSLPISSEFNKRVIELENSRNRDIIELVEAGVPLDVAREQIDDRLMEARRKVYGYNIPEGHGYGIESADLNRMAILRVNDRVGPNGERILHIDEYQDDLQNEIQSVKQSIKEAQTRKSTAKIEERFLPEEKGRARYVILSEGSKPGVLYANRQDAEEDLERFKSAQDREIKELTEEQRHLESLLPFRGKSHELAMKYALGYAINHGYDMITWATGQQVADRYSLARYINTLRYYPTKIGYYLAGYDKQGIVFKKEVSRSELSDFVGNEIADKIISNQGSEIKTGVDTWKELSNLDLTVGGGGKLHLYDKMIPDFMRKYTKRWGGDTTNTPIEIGEKPSLNRYSVTDASQIRVEYRESGNPDMVGWHVHSYREDGTYDQSLAGPLTDREYAEELAQRFRQEYVKGAPSKIFATVHSLSITPQMRDSIARSGQSLFGSSEGQPSAVTNALMEVREKQIRRRRNPSLVELESKRAYHGSPHSFGQFSTEKIGTGEGAQAYGHGLYFADKKEVASHYLKAIPHNQIVKEFRRALPDDADFDDVIDLLGTGHFTPNQERVIQALKSDDWLGFDYPAQAISAAYRNLEEFDPSQELRDAIGDTGALYTVDLAPAEDEYLLWDKPLSEQSEKIREALQPVRNDRFDLDPRRGTDIETGATAYTRISQTLGGERTFGEGDLAWSAPISDDKAASEYLRSLGIRGIKYLAGDSRAKGEGAYNYVIFDDADITIVEISKARTREGKAAAGYNPRLLEVLAQELYKENIPQVTVKESIQNAVDSLTAAFPKGAKEEQNTILDPIISEINEILDKSDATEKEKQESFDIINVGQIGEEFMPALLPNRLYNAMSFEDEKLLTDLVHRYISAKYQLTGRIKIDVDSSNRSITIADNGIGMIPSVAEEEFLDPGGSYKPGEEQTVGGYGIAKVAILGNAQTLDVRTVAVDPETGNKIETHIWSDPDMVDESGDYVPAYRQWRDANYSLNIDSYEVADDTPTGTIIEIRIREDISKDQLTFNADTLYNLVVDTSTKSTIPFEIVYKDNEFNKFNSGQSTPQKKTLVKSIYTSESIIDIYASDYTSKYAQVHYLNHGLYQFTDSMSVNQGEIPSSIFIDVKAKGKPGQGNYPWIPSREGLRGEAYEEVNNFLKNLEKEVQAAAAQRERQSYINALTKAPIIEGAEPTKKGIKHAIVDTSGVAPKELIDSLVKAPYAQPLSNAIDNLFTMIQERMSKRNDKYKAVHFMGIGLGHDYLGVNIPHDLAFGIEGPDLILINPYNILYEIGMLVKTGDIDSVTEMKSLFVDYIFNTIVHEIAHRKERGHGYGWNSTGHQGETERWMAALARDRISMTSDLLEVVDQMNFNLFTHHMTEVIDAYKQTENIFAKIGIKSTRQPESRIYKGSTEISEERGTGLGSSIQEGGGYTTTELPESAESRRGIPRLGDKREILSEENITDHIYNYSEESKKLIDFSRDSIGDQMSNEAIGRASRAGRTIHALGRGVEAFIDYRESTNRLYVNDASEEIIRMLRSQSEGEAKDSVYGATFNQARLQALINTIDELLQAPLNPIGVDVLHDLYDVFRTSLKHNQPLVITDVSSTPPQYKVKKVNNKWYVGNLPRPYNTPTEALKAAKWFGARSTIKHEEIHRIEFMIRDEFGGVLPDVNELLSLPHMRHLTRRIKAKGYNHDPRVVVMEAIARISTGDNIDLEMTLEEEVEFLDAYFTLMADTYHENVLDQFKLITNKAREVRDEVKEGFRQISERSRDTGEIIQGMEIGREGGIEGRVREGPSRAEQDPKFTQRIIDNSFNYLESKIERGTLGRSPVEDTYHITVVTGYDILRDNPTLSKEDWSKEVNRWLGVRSAPHTDAVWDLVSGKAPTYYSPIENLIRTKIPNKASVGQIRGVLKNVSEDEMKWSGLDILLKEKEKSGDSVTKQEILDYLSINNIKIKAITSGVVLDHLNWENTSPTSYKSIDTLGNEYLISWESDSNSYLVELFRISGEILTKKADSLEAAQGVAESMRPDNITPNEAVANEIQELEENGWVVESNPDNFYPNLVRFSPIDSSDEWPYDLYEPYEMPEDLHYLARTIETAFLDSRGTRYSAYKLEGGDRYVEIRITLPTEERLKLPYGWRVFETESGLWVVEDKEGKIRGFGNTEEEAILVSAQHEQFQPTDIFQSPHWDEPNVLAHIRGDEREHIDGVTGFVIDETQSDWHGEGRKKGFRITPTAKEAGQGVPEMPFVKQWPLLTVKQSIKHAVQRGLSRISLLPSRVHIERWGTERVIWNPVYVVVNKHNYDEVVNADLHNDTPQKAQDWIDYRKQMGLDVKGYTIEKAYLFQFKPQEGGVAGGINLEQQGLIHGLLSEEGTKVIQSKDDIRQIIEESRGIQNPEYLADRIWARIQKQDSGVYWPRAEGQVAHYGDTTDYIQKRFPNRPDLLKYAWDRPDGKQSEAFLPIAIRDVGKSWKASTAIQHAIIEKDVGALKGDTEPITLQSGFRTRKEAQRWIDDNYPPRVGMSSEDDPTHPVLSKNLDERGRIRGWKVVQRTKTLTTPAYSLDITPQMSNAVIRTGQPLFGTSPDDPSYVLDAKMRMTPQSRKNIIDMGIVIGHNILSEESEFDGWSNEMIRQLGESIKPHLEPIWNRLQQANNILSEELTPKESSVVIDVVRDILSEETESKKKDNKQRRKIAKQVQKLFKSIPAPERIKFSNWSKVFEIEDSMKTLEAAEDIYKEEIKELESKRDPNQPKKPRHELTQEERSRGYWNAVESIVRRHFPLMDEKEGVRLARKYLASKMNQPIDEIERKKEGDKPEINLSDLFDELIPDTPPQEGPPKIKGKSYSERVIIDGWLYNMEQEMEKLRSGGIPIPQNLIKTYNDLKAERDKSAPPATAGGSGEPPSPPRRNVPFYEEYMERNEPGGPAGQAPDRDIRWYDFAFLRSRLSNLDFVGTYERVGGDLGRDASDIIRNAQVAIGTGVVSRPQGIKQMKKDLQPIIEAWRYGGKPGLAFMLEDHILGIASGRGHRSTIARMLKKIQYDTKLRFNVKSTVLNILQPLQTLWPHVTTQEFVRLMYEARKSSVRKAVLDKVNKSAGAKVEGETEKKRWLPDMFSKASDTNRIMGYLHGMNEAKRFGFSDFKAERHALDWAKKVEFDNSEWDVIPLFDGDIASVLAQFKGFTVKNIESIMTDLRKHKEDSFGGYASRVGKRVLAQLALGGIKSIPGVKPIMGLLVLGAITKALQAVGFEDDDAEMIAEIMYYGAPALIGEDISTSMMILDPPFGDNVYEQLVNFALGPTVSTAAGVLDKGIRKRDPVSAAKAVSPYYRMGESLADIVRWEPTILPAPGGRQIELNRFETIMRALGFTPLKQSRFYEGRGILDLQSNIAASLGLVKSKDNIPTQLEWDVIEEERKRYMDDPIPDNATIERINIEKEVVKLLGENKRIEARDKLKSAIDKGVFAPADADRMSKKHEYNEIAKKLGLSSGYLLYNTSIKPLEISLDRFLDPKILPEEREGMSLIIAEKYIRWLDQREEESNTGRISLSKQEYERIMKKLNQAIKLGLKDLANKAASKAATSR